MVEANRLRSVLVAAALAVLAASCGSGDGDGGPRSVTVVTHDAFAVSDDVVAGFEAETGIDVTFVTSADVGSMVSEAILTADNPLGDVMFGVDNTFLSRALDADLFEPYQSELLDRVPDELELDAEHRVTPVDFGDVCVNVWLDRFTEAPPPASLADLVEPAYAGTFVTANPETSSPGLAFLLATIAVYGEEGWEQYWEALADNGVRVTSGWTEAYYGEFVAGGGDAAVVTSYASSPVAEVVFADPPVDTPPTAIITDSCFRQIEFAGILAGTEHRREAEEFLDFLLSDPFQEDVPLNMFVFPASSTAELPAEFVEHAVLPETPLTLDPELIEAERDRWTERWVEIVLR